MISTNEFKTGMTIELDNEVYTIVDFQHVKPGKGAAFVRTKLKNLKTGGVTEKTFRAGEKVERAMMDRREMQYLYNSGDEYNVMDTETYEQMALSADQLGNDVKYLKENMNIAVLFYQDQIFGIELPFFVELEVKETDPGIKGDTASGGTKPATMETGLVVQVPFFINAGDVLRIDTRSGEYIERV
ncbi:elongation factor P [Dethiobacter alkaliphilus]|uniref:Elongation factor P n=1 Tax=Dethiobacter alkaliphilus AHT 1 TaxID=555088 RepID=C0GE45_DETAL|nr:elongation factor P [Dethiobacter alkaliphilus]EEG78339.1 translation elongation factor P [Dethiobacter alkaliphilus AHT 1]MCW3490283.1 elongation factor P [Dethiobacter alkaliphilus]